MAGFQKFSKILKNNVFSEILSGGCVTQRAGGLSCATQTPPPSELRTLQTKFLKKHRFSKFSKISETRPPWAGLWAVGFGLSEFQGGPRERGAGGISLFWTRRLAVGPYESEEPNHRKVQTKNGTVALYVAHALAWAGESAAVPV